MQNSEQRNSVYLSADHCMVPVSSSAGYNGGVSGITMKIFKLLKIVLIKPYAELQVQPLSILYVEFMT